MTMANQEEGAGLTIQQITLSDIAGIEDFLPLISKLRGCGIVLTGGKASIKAIADCDHPLASMLAENICEAEPYQAPKKTWRDWLRSKPKTRFGRAYVGPVIVRALPNSSFGLTGISQLDKIYGSMTDEEKAEDLTRNASVKLRLGKTQSTSN